ncbi:MAG: hypothetical protein QUU85_18365, partial [Candidatus Eisenbacteria bacterium]|nr:hypothetical protein [Candidatus Eisenbacteria bacterium]
MRTLLIAATLVMLCAADAVQATVLYQQPPRDAGGFYRSSWWDPDGSNYDEYVWDRFVLSQDADIDSIHWRGCYDPAYYGAGGPVRDFTVAVYASIPGGSEPDVVHLPLVEYTSGDNAGETFAGAAGGVNMYDYQFALPVPFHAQAGVPYWVQIEGWQWGFPDWAIAAGTGGDGSHFRCQHNNEPGKDGVPTGCYFTRPSGDCAFHLLTSAPAAAVEGTTADGGFALSGVLPNPSSGDRMEIGFRLPDDQPAELALFDVAGRRLWSRQV